MRFFTLYSITLLLEVVSGIFRFSFFATLVAFFIFPFALFENRWMLDAAQYDPSLNYWETVRDGTLAPAAVIGLLLSYGNIFASLHAAAGFGGGLLFTRFVFGAREKSTRERAKIEEVYRRAVLDNERNGASATATAITNSFHQIRGLSRTLIIDAPMEYAYLIGTTLYVSSAAINSPHLPVLLMHELGHNQNGDGSKILALRRLVFPLFQIFIGDVKNFSTGRTGGRPRIREFDAEQVYYGIVNKIIFFWLAMVGGGIGVWVMSWAWARYFRQRDYLADSFVARVGYKDQLIEYMEQNKFYDTAVPYMLAWRPAHELRLDRLQNPHLLERRSRLKQLIETIGGWVERAIEFTRRMIAEYGIRMLARASYWQNPITAYLVSHGPDPLGTEWEPAFAQSNGMPPTDTDRQDRLFSLLHRGSGPAGSWTEADWRRYSSNRREYWQSTSWDGSTPGMERFLNHLQRLAAYYGENGDPSAFVRAVGLLWGGIPYKGDAFESLLQAGPPLLQLHEGTAGWPAPSGDGSEPVHHWARNFVAGYYYKPPGGIVSNQIWQRWRTSQGNGHVPDMRVVNAAVGYGSWFNQKTHSESRSILFLMGTVQKYGPIYP